MRGVNKVIVIGYADRDAELRHTGPGKAVSSLRLATNRTVKGEEEAQVHAVVCWDRLAETTAAYGKKGDPLYVEGRLQYRSYQDEEGQERGACEIVADDVQFLARRGTGNRVEPDQPPHQAVDPGGQHRWPNDRRVAAAPPMHYRVPEAFVAGPARNASACGSATSARFMACAWSRPSSPTKVALAMRRAACALGSGSSSVPA